MREKSLIKDVSPCDTDFNDSTMQSVSDAKKKGRVLCSNLEQCQKRSIAEGIQCYRRVASQMAGFIIDNKKSFEKIVEAERKEYLESAPDGKFWVFRDGKWSVIEGKQSVINDIVAFARIIIDMKEGERRPFTQDGMHVPVLGLDDQQYNDILDLQGIAGEVTHK